MLQVRSGKGVSLDFGVQILDEAVSGIRMRVLR